MILSAKYQHLLLTVLCFLFINVQAQQKWPEILAGTWQIEGKQEFEQWNLLNQDNLKGLGYTFSNNSITPNEYLTFRRQGKKWIYEATVVNQNNGKTIPFAVEIKDSLLTLTNNKHDFPKKIQYKLLTDQNLEVIISDNASKKIRYKLIKKGKAIADKNIKNPNYDDALAQSLQSDDFGMKSYFWVILKSGTNNNPDTTLRNESFRQHMKNINRLVDAKQLIVAGPLGKNDRNYRGIFIFHHISSKDELEKILQSDEAIKNKYLDFEIYNWYGSAALPLYLEAADKIWKNNP